MTLQGNNGVESRRSLFPVEKTVNRLTNLLEAKGIRLFAMVDHSGEAVKIGMKMRPTKLLIFGNPAAGTPGMIAVPTLALDLPLKILVWEDSEGNAWLSWNSPEYLQRRHGVPEELLKNLGAAEMLAAKVGDEAQP